MDEEQFKFNFQLEQIVEEWKTLDNEEEDEPHNDDDDGDNLNAVSQESFFAPHYKDGIDYFTITNPEKVKQEWLEARKLIIPHIQNVVKHLVREKFQK
uniref:Uncharacterized protein n=1 Tax=Trichobilharzia regenti TaxID=157069 RepID=A0AA85IYN4_TRIRE|nr:unnamed protein product [Trichobilharzia regenti]